MPAVKQQRVVESFRVGESFRTGMGTFRRIEGGTTTSAGQFIAAREIGTGCPAYLPFGLFADQSKLTKEELQQLAGLLVRYGHDLDYHREEGDAPVSFYKAQRAALLKLVDDVEEALEFVD